MKWLTTKYSPASILSRSLLLLSIILIALDAIIHRHTTHPWEEMFGFYGFFGFIACTVLVLIAKEMRKWLLRSEDYYRHREQQGDHHE